MGKRLVGTPARALITGVLGQDGSYLAQLLLLKGYEVFGVGHRASGAIVDSLQRMSPDSFHMIKADIRSPEWISDTLDSVRPTEIYNFAAQTSVARSFTEPELTHELNFMALSNLIDALVSSRLESKLYQASSSEMYGLTGPPQNESSLFLPQSPYGLAKTAAHELVAAVRSREGLFAVSGIAFNHESPRRSQSFATRKISSGVAAIVRGEAQSLRLGNVDAIRDWGYAPEYVEGMWRSLQQDTPDDYVFASGTGHSVRDFAQFAFESVGLDWRDFVVYDESLVRAKDTKASIGDPSRARDILGWSAQVSASDLAQIMVESDLSGRSDLDTPRISCWS